MFGYLNKFWGELNLYNKLFFFQDLNLNISNKEEKLKKLILATNLNKNINLNSSTNTIIDEKNGKIDDSTIKNFRNEKVKESPQNEQNKGNFDFNCYNNNKLTNSYQEKENKAEYKENNFNSNNNINNININNKSINNFLAESNLTSENNITTSNENIIKTDKEPAKIEYEYHLFDFIKKVLCKCNCCKSKQLRIRDALTEKANLLLYNKLDIALYIRNMIYFDIMKDILLNSETKDIANFLVHPIISLSNDEKNELPSLHNKYTESDFDKFYQAIIQLSNKEEKTNEEIRLISLTNNHLKKIDI